MITFFHSGVRCEIKINMNGFTSRINFFCVIRIHTFRTQGEAGAGVGTVSSHGTVDLGG